MYQELVAQRAFVGGYDTVKNAVRRLRAEAALASLPQRRCETEPGQQAQVGWGRVKVPLRDGPLEIHIFVMTQGYSRRTYAEGCVHQRMGSLLAAPEQAFAHFGGGGAELLYDRLRTGRAKGARAGIRPLKPLPNPGVSNRGCVESGVTSVKRNFLPGRTFWDLDEFHTRWHGWLQEGADGRGHGTTHRRPIDRCAEDGLVSIDRNRCSVPGRLIGQTVQVVRAGGGWPSRLYWPDGTR